MSAALKLQFVIEAVDHATAKIRNVQKTMDAALAPITKMTQGFSVMGDRLKALADESGLTRIKAGMDGVAARLSTLPMIAAISLGGVVAAISRTEERLTGVVRTAMRFNMPTAQLQGLGFAASQAGVGPEELADGMQHLAVKMAEARAGSAESIQVFQALGMHMQKLKTSNVSDVMNLIADKFNRVGDIGNNVSTKFRILRELMSRSGPDLKNFFDQGSAGIKIFSDHAAELGMTIDEKGAKGIIKFTNTMNELRGVMDGMMAKIVTRLNPVLITMLENLTGKNMATRDTIVKVVGDALESLIKNVPKFAKGFGQITSAVDKLFTALNFVVKAVGGWDTLFTLFAITMGVKAVLALELLTAAILKLHWAFVSTPLGRAILLVTGLVFALKLLFENLDAVIDAWSAVWEGMKAPFIEFYEWFADAIKPIAGLLESVFGGPGGLPKMGFSLTGTEAQTPRPLASSFGAGVNQPGQGTSPIRPELRGQITIGFDNSGLPRVRQLSANPGSVFDLNVTNGLTLTTP